MLFPFTKLFWFGQLDLGDQYRKPQKPNSIVICILDKYTYLSWTVQKATEAYIHCSGQWDTSGGICNELHKWLQFVLMWTKMSRLDLPGASIALSRTKWFADVGPWNSCLSLLAWPAYPPLHCLQYSCVQLSSGLLCHVWLSCISRRFLEWSPWTLYWGSGLALKWDAHQLILLLGCLWKSMRGGGVGLLGLMLTNELLISCLPVQLRRLCGCWLCSGGNGALPPACR